MASKNLGAVIQRAISDGAFRRQLQSDPATALRGFNLSPDEVAAIRSGDSGKLMSLGVDQRMSKAFSVGASFGGPSARSTVSDGLAAGTSSAITDGAGSIARENIVGDPTSNSRSALTADTDGDMRSANTPGDTASMSDAHSSGSLSGTRAVFNTEPSDTGLTVSDPTAAGTRSVFNTEPFEGNAGLNTGAGSAGSSALEDPNSPEFAARLNVDSPAGTRAVFNTEPFEGNANANAGTSDLSTRALHNTEPVDGTSAAASGSDLSTRAVFNTEPFNTGAAASDPYSGQYSGVTPDFQAGRSAAAADAGGTGGGGAMISADDNLSVASRMADANLADATRQVHDVNPFDSGTASATSDPSMLGGAAHLDPGIESGGDHSATADPTLDGGGSHNLS
jgi:hypothetical protein